MKKLSRSKNCKYCTKLFITTNNSKTFCNKNCANKYYNKIRIKKEFKKIKCLICGNSFLPKSSKEKYCSENCRSIRGSGKWRKNNRKKLTYTDELNKKPKYFTEQYSSTELRAISILRSNGFDSVKISEVIGRTRRSIKHRISLNDVKKYTFPGDNKIIDVKTINNFYQKIDRNWKVSETVANNILFNKLLTEGFQIFKAREGNEFDSVAYKNGKYFKLQIKKLGFDEKSNSFQINGSGFFKFHAKTKKYENFKYSDIDFFAFVCLGVEKIYIIPFEEIKQSVTKPTSNLQFYPHRVRRIFTKILNTDLFYENIEILK